MPRPRMSPTEDFIWSTLLPIVAINEQREKVLRAALAKRGWEFVQYYLGPSIYEAKVTFRSTPSHYWYIDVKVPETTPRTKLDDALRDALVGKIARRQLDEKKGTR